MRVIGKSKSSHVGKRLRKLRQVRGLTLRQVAEASIRIARRRHKRAYALRISGLYEIEIQARVPHIYHLYTLSQVYGVGLHQILQWYGIPRGGA